MQVSADVSSWPYGESGAANIFMRWHLEYPDGDNSQDFTTRIDEEYYGYQWDVDNWMETGTYTLWAQFQSNAGIWGEWIGIEHEIHT
jgi:hypothetical protein